MISAGKVVPSLGLEVGEGLREGLLAGQVGEGHADHLGGRQPEQALGALGDEQEAAIRVAAVDDVRRRLDQLPEARLGFLEVALEAIAVAHIADRAIGPDKPTGIVEQRGGDELGGDRRPVAAEQVDPTADFLRAGAHPGRPVEVGDLLRRWVDEGAEALPHELVGPEAGQPLHRVGHEGQPGIGADRPDDVRGVLDQVAIALLGFRQARQQGRIGDGDGRLVGQALEQVELLGRERPWQRRRDRERADDLATWRPQRSGGHPAQVQPLGDRLVVGVVGDARIGRVVAGPDRLST